jgi:hypothetical protein
LLISIHLAYLVLYRGNRGVDAIMKGAFQRVSAHIAVDAIGGKRRAPTIFLSQPNLWLKSTSHALSIGKFWQLMLAERALQSACGPERSIKVFAEQDDINLEYCDREDATADCALLLDGRPVRHVRLDARVAVVSDIKRREIALKKSVPMKKKFHEEQAPWFL